MRNEYRENREVAVVLICLLCALVFMAGLVTFTCLRDSNKLWYQKGRENARTVKN